MTTAGRLADLLRRHVRTDGPFTLSSGETSSWYLDARQATFDGAGAAIVGDAVLAVLVPDVAAVGGMTMGADPVAVATALRGAQAGRPLRAYSVRKAAKGYGTGGRLVGPVSQGDQVAILEDTSTTGGSLAEVAQVLAGAGIHVRQAVTLVDRGSGEPARRMAEAGIPYVAILTPADLGVET